MKNWKSCLATALALVATTVFSAEPLLLQWGTIDTSGTEAQAESTALKAKVAQKAALARARKSADEERAAYVVQFPGPITEEWRTWLESSTQVRGYLPEFAYLVWATATEMDAIAADPAVHWTGEWRNEYKTVRARTAFSAKSGGADAPVRWMHISSLLAGDDGAADLRARLEALGAPVRSAFARLDGSAAVAFLSAAQVDEAADWPDVEWIEPVVQAVPCNDKAVLANMMDVDAARASLSSGGLGLTGEGQWVAVADTGLDIGSTDNIHPDFAGRVIGYAWTNGNYTASASWKDIGGHGTHVCGSVLGSGAASSNQYRGVAYGAKLVLQGCWTNLSGVPQTYLGPMLQQAASAGAYIHSDSWGYGTNSPGAYIQSCPYIDAYMWTNQNFLMVIAAGNEGVDADADGVIDPGSVSAPGTAKNCLCVGAAENWRNLSNTYAGNWPDDYPAAPIAGDKVAQTNTPQGLAAFSGRGPTKDGRIKPDIVAPGTYVISARSRAADRGTGGVANTNYTYMSGTSMATPLTSGALALVRQWLVERKGITEPPAALMKALLINGARDMTPGQYGTGTYQEITARPDFSQGFGHVDLFNSLEPGAGNFLVFVTNKLSSGNFATNIAVGRSNAGKYVFTLVWQDYPASSGAKKTLVNDLDLTVTSPSGTVYYPNNLGALDHTNNVEFIDFTASETGEYAVKVNAHSVSKTNGVGGQPFALVMRGPETALEETAPVFSADTASVSCYKGETISFSFESLLTAGYPAPRYNMSTAVTGFTFDSSTGTLSFTPSAAGTYVFTGSAFNDLGTATCVLTVTATLPPPGVPAGLVLSDVGTDSFTASWSSASDAESYTLDVATVTGSTTPVALVKEEFTDFSTTSYSTSIATQTVASGSWAYESIMMTPGGPASGDGSSGFAQMQANNGKLYLPLVDNPSTLSVVARTSSGSLTLQQKISGTWTTIGSWNLTSTGAEYTHIFTNAGTAAALRFVAGSKATYIHDITLSGPSASYSSIPGYPKNVSATSYGVAGLTPATDYAARVRAVNSTAESDWTDWSATTTLAGLSAPSWIAIPAQNYLFGNNNGVFDFDVSPYASGSPDPEFHLADTPLEAIVLTTGEFSFEPDALGTFDFTVIASNTQGTASTTLSVAVTAAPPAFVDLPATVTGCAGEDVIFTVAATGNPTPLLDIIADEELLWMFNPSTGLFEFNSDDTGDFSFVFTASNIAAVASQTVTVTITDAPVTVPTLTVADITDTSALASWTACDGVSSYTLQLASDDQFTTGGSGATVTLFSNDGTSATAPDGWTYSINSASSGYPVLASNNYVVSEAVDASSCIGLSLSLSMRTYGTVSSGTTNLLVQYSADGGASWTDIGTLSVPNKTWATRTLDASAAAGAADLRIRFVSTSPSTSSGVGIQSIVLTGTESAAGGSLISTDTVNGLSHAFTGLDPVTTYYARVKGDSDWSSVVSFTTQSTGDSAPVWTAIPDQTVDVGTNCWLNLADYVSGTPAPAITLVSTTADSGDYEFEDGYLMFAPPAAGSYTFTFMASNSVGTANATLTVTGHAEAPVLTASLGTALSSTVGDNVEFTVTAAGIPAPTTIDATCTEGVYFIFENGEFLFDSPAIGTYHFVFTATNVAGSDTLTVTVTVSAAPVTVPELTVSDVTDTTALATWTACDGVSAYTLQLSTNDFAAAASSAAARDVTTLLTEHFTDATGMSTAAISDFDAVTDNDGWEGSYVYTHNGTVRISSSKNTGDIESPWLTNATAGATVTLAFDSLSWTNAATIVNVTVTEDGSTYSDPISFALTETMTTYTTNFTVYGTRFRVRWAPSAANKRFFLDDVVITSASSGGDDIETFTVSGTSHIFTNLTSETIYYARVKGASSWSGTETFTTLASPVDPFEQWLADHDASGHAAGEEAPNGYTYGQNYAADIDPSSPDFLDLVVTDVSSGEFSILKSSPNRWYQLLYTTDLSIPRESYTATNLGKGATSGSFPVDGDWFGGIRVLPYAP